MDNDLTDDEVSLLIEQADFEQAWNPQVPMSEEGLLYELQKVGRKAR